LRHQSVKIKAADQKGQNLAHYSIHIQNLKAEVYTAPGTGLLRVHIPNKAALIYNPQSQAFLDAASGSPTTLQLSKSTYDSFLAELNSIDLWRNDFYAGRLKTEYSLPEAKSNAVILSLADEIDRLLALACPNERDFKRRCAASRLRDNEKALIEALWDIRHKIAHNQLGPVITINQETIDKIERVRDKLAQKRQAQNIMIKRAQIFAASWSDAVLPIVGTMLSQQYSHVPILSKGDVYEGVFTGETVLRALATDTILELDSRTKFEDFRPHIAFGISDQPSEKVVFVRPNTSIAKLSNIVAEHRDKRVKVSLFLVTSSGKPSDSVQGLITVWDLPGES
jgi:CBS domain-containing protein